MLGIPLRGPIIPMGRIKISKKNPYKILYTFSKITDLYGNLQCFVLAGQFEGGGNPIARLVVLAAELISHIGTLRYHEDRES